MTDTPAIQRPHLTVIAADAADVVASAGGLICDRVRQGWRVVVRIPVGLHTRSLRILGATVVGEAADEDRSTHAALLTSTTLYARDRAIRSEVDSAVATKTTEVLLWGATSDLVAARSVTHRLSAAALAFKAHALLAAKLPPHTVEPTEAFRTTCALDVLARELDVAG